MEKNGGLCMASSCVRSFCKASLRTQVTLLKQSHAAAQEEIVRLRGLLTQRCETHVIKLYFDVYQYAKIKQIRSPNS